MFNRFALPQKIARRLSTRGATASWSRPVVQIATVGVAVGMALIVLATSIVHGFQEEVKELVVGFGADMQVLNADYEERKIVRSEGVERKLAALSGVDEVHPFYSMPAILESGEGVKGAVAKGLNAETSERLLGRFLIEGHSDLEEGEAVLSYEQTKRLGLVLSDRFTVYLVGGPTGVRARSLVLAGIYRSGLLEYDEEFMFLPAALIQQSAGWGFDLQLVFDSVGVVARGYGGSKPPRIEWLRRGEKEGEVWRSVSGWIGNEVAWEALTEDEYVVTASSREYGQRMHPDSVRLFRNVAGEWEWERMGAGWQATASGLEVFVNSQTELWDAEETVYAELPLGWRTETVLQQAPEMFTWLGMLDLNVEIIIGLMVLISIINMTSALLILILERRPMVGMLKALGMADGDVMRIFFWQSVRILGRGFLWGNTIGVLLVVLQSQTGVVTLNPEAYYLDVVPVHFDWGYLLAVEIMAFGACALMMWLPSLASIRIRPAEALRINR